MSHKDDFERIRKSVESALNQNEDPEEIAWTVVEGVSAIIDGATGANVAGLASGALKSIRDGVGLTESIEAIPNPYFVFNGHADDPDTAYTRKYLRKRSIKGFAGGLFGLAGTASSQARSSSLGEELEVARLVRSPASSSRSKRRRFLPRTRKISFWPSRTSPTSFKPSGRISVARFFSEARTLLL